MIRQGTRGLRPQECANRSVERSTDNTLAEGSRRSPRCACGPWGLLFIIEGAAVFAADAKQFHDILDRDAVVQGVIGGQDIPRVS